MPSVIPAHRARIRAIAMNPPTAQLRTRRHGRDVEGVALGLDELFQKAGYQSVFPPILQPLEMFLEYAGEDIRKRLYSVSDSAGGEYCLRPDLTIPCCRLYLASLDGAADEERRLCYRGTAFRHHAGASGKPSEFLQVGAEYFGCTDAEEADAEIMSLALSSLRALGCEGFELEMGDLRLFDAFLDAIGESPKREIFFWSRRLKEAFHQSDKEFRLLLQQAAATAQERRAARPDAKTEDAETALRLLESLPADAPLGGRSPEEIRARFLERQERQNLPPLPQKIHQALREFLRIRAPFPQAVKDIRRICAQADIDMGAASEKLNRRAECLHRRGIATDAVCLATTFGRRLGYYTGFAFELRVGAVQIAAGGRYDRLLQALGSARAIPAVGCALRPDRIAALWPDAAARFAK